MKGRKKTKEAASNGAEKRDDKERTSERRLMRVTKEKDKEEQE